MSARHSQSIRRTLVYAWGAIVLVVISALALANHMLARQFKTSFEWVSHTEQVLRRLGEALSCLKDIENGQRGYALTGETAYLEPYHNGLAELHGTLDELTTLTADNPRQQTRLLALRAAFEGRIKIAEETIAAREGEGFDAALVVINSGRGRAAMESARQIVREFEREERRLLAAREIAARESLDRQQYFGIAMVALLVVSSGVAFWFQRRLTEMQNFVKVCAWTRQIEHDGKWMSMESFLKARFGLETSHGMSQKAADEFRDELQISQ